MEGKRKVDLVFEGGGVKGIGLAGAFAALEERDYRPHGVAGTSAGAIAAALVAAGYDAGDLHAILDGLPFADFRDKGVEDHVPFVGAGLSILTQRGIYEGRFFHRWISGLLEDRGVTRFGQLRDDDAANGKHRYRLRVIASDVTERRMLVLPDDADRLGIDPDELAIADAVRMSMSIPIFFEPVVHENPRTGAEHVIVDGGMLSNFPVWLFDRTDGEPRWPTFGLMLVEPDPKTHLGERLPEAERGAGSIVDYVKSLAQTMMEAHDRMYLEQETFARTIPIPTLGVRTTEFDITPERRRALYDAGHAAALEFLATWDFDAYVAEFRRGRARSRRDELAERLAGA